MLLLGAGASVEAEVPAANKMTERIADIFRASPQHEIYSRVVAFVVGGLLFKRGIEGGNALTTGVNVEELFNAVQFLSERNTLEAAPFVGSWHSMVEEFESAWAVITTSPFFKQLQLPPDFFCSVCSTFFPYFAVSPRRRLVLSCCH